MLKCTTIAINAPKQSLPIIFMYYLLLLLVLLLLLLHSQVYVGQKCTCQHGIFNFFTNKLNNINNQYQNASCQYRNQQCFMIKQKTTGCGNVIHKKKHQIYVPMFLRLYFTQNHNLENFPIFFYVHSIYYHFLVLMYLLTNTNINKCGQCIQTNINLTPTSTFRNINYLSETQENSQKLRQVNSLVCKLSKQNTHKLRKITCCAVQVVHQCHQ
eukprot:TRINITY_DN3220_c0_g4_i1.p2 TRINITY_DN3220_c0_g4~~TRINITY_DN3220_c0_g4_i1.p2  ORF type:complete len:213 (+),score=-23.22 TRINITY_DN3220_c0_g4_i1:802-1440(+)